MVLAVAESVGWLGFTTACVSTIGAWVAAYYGQRNRRDLKEVSHAVNDVDQNSPNPKTLREKVDEIHDSTVDSDSSPDAGTTTPK